MSRRRRGDDTKVAVDMTPMIDVVFQLLVFFLFTFKIVPTEGEFSVDMPPSQSGAASEVQPPPPIEPIRIRLIADGGGQLADIRVENNVLGPDPKQLNTLIKTLVGDNPPPDTQVEIDADPRLQYEYLILITHIAMNTGLEKVNFTDPRSKPAN